MLNFNNFNNIDDDLPSFSQVNIQEPNPSYYSEEEFTFFEKNNYFVQEKEKYFLDISAKTYFSSYKENDNTNNQTNRINYTINIDMDTNNPSYLRRKTKREKNIKNLDNEENEENIVNNKQSSNKKSKSNKNMKHNKYCEDNIINKIKGCFFNSYIIGLVIKNSIYDEIKLKKLPNKKFIADLNKEKNEKLFKMKISDILCQQKISSKYTKFDEYENKKLIEKIYKEKKEMKVIKILELTFEELFIIFRRKLNDPDDMNKLEEIKDKIKGLDLLKENNKYKDIEYLIKKFYKKNYEDIDDYIKKVKEQCLNYENWFGKKRGRASRKKRLINFN